MVVEMYLPDLALIPNSLSRVKQAKENGNHDPKIRIKKQLSVGKIELI